MEKKAEIKIDKAAAYIGFYASWAEAKTMSICNSFWL
jgi:hypothetical protein